MMRRGGSIGVRIATAWFLCLCMLGAGCVTTLAAPGEGEMYTEEFIDPDTGRPVYAFEGSTAMVDGVFYTRHDARLYRWVPGETAPVQYCDLPPVPAGLPYDWDELPENIAGQLSEAVTHIAAGEGALWAFNDYALRIGKIDQGGVHWLPIALDRGVIPSDFSLRGRVSRCWVREGALECLVNLADRNDSMEMARTVLRFDLGTGAAGKVELPSALMACAYKPGSYLAYTVTYDEGRGERISTLFAVDGVTGTRTALPQEVVSAEYAIGGLSYDATVDRICYAYQGEIWGSTAGAPFESVAYLPVAAVYDDAQAWQLPGDIYAILTGGLYVRNMDPQYRPRHTLRLHGVWSDETYKRFLKAHPEVPAIIAEYNEPMAAEIAQGIREGTSDVDIYAMNADSSWHALIEKGYVADLSASDKLVADVARMYPAMRAALQDEAGRLMGYPVILYGSLWSVDEKLWARFDMGPLPVTYDQLLDAWLRWDAELAEANPEIAFLQGGYDRFSVTYMLLTDYIRRYEQPGQPLDLNAPLLHDLLAKAEKIDFGDWAERNKNGEVNDEFNEWINRPALLSQYGNMGLMGNPEETSIYAADSEDLRESNVLHSVPMLPPVFVEGEEPMFHGQMQVLFVNPASPNFEAALAYIEGAIDASDEVTYLAHPDRNEPRMREDFEKMRKQHEAYRAEEVERLKIVTDPLERKDTQERIDYYDRWLADAESNKWAVSPGAIRRIREFAPYMRFAEHAAILSYDGSGGMDHLMNLLERYSAGQMTLDAFLKELNNKLRMVVLEGR